jgi:hypothetical protein
MIINHAQKWFQEAKGEELRRLRMQIRTEMEDDPHWCMGQQDAEINGAIGFDFERYFCYAREVSTFATFFNIAAYVRMSGISTIVFQKGWGGTLTKTWEQPGTKVDVQPVRVLLDGKHYELLCLYEADKGILKHQPLAKKQRFSGKQTEAVKKRPAVV